MMIGDWVWLVEPEDGHRELVRITSSDLNKVGMSFMEPVNLTREFMEKNFPEYEEGYEIGWFDNPIGSFSVEYQDDVCQIVLKTVYYVHEIQHLLKLIGSGKEVVV